MAVHSLRSCTCAPRRMGRLVAERLLHVFIVGIRFRAAARLQMCRAAVLAITLFASRAVLFMQLANVVVASRRFAGSARMLAIDGAANPLFEPCAQLQYQLSNQGLAHAAPPP